MNYHRFRFGIRGNLKVLLCKVFGHRINENPAHPWCERCGLAYTECYHPVDYLTESGRIDMKRYDAKGNLKCKECREREAKSYE